MTAVLPARREAAARGRHRRTTFVCLALVVVVVAVFVAAMTVGGSTTVGEIWLALTGRGTRRTNFVVYDVRLPRALTSILVGLCLGASGAIFQAMIGNPLATPDVIGINAGASAAAVFAILWLGLSGLVLSGFALAGAVAVAAVVYLLAYRAGMSGYRFVLIGIAVGAVMSALTAYQMTRAQVQDAQVALRWLTGNLNGASMSTVQILALLCALCVPALVIATPWLSGLQLGDDLATAIGVRVTRAKAVLTLLGAALAAIATAAAGPIGFVAVIAGPIAARLTHSVGRGNLIASGLVGACVVSLADFTGGRLAPAPLPVGILTAIIGVPYFVVLLIRTSRA